MSEPKSKIFLIMRVVKLGEELTVMFTKLIEKKGTITRIML